MGGPESWETWGWGSWQGACFPWGTPVDACWVSQAAAAGVWGPRVSTTETASTEAASTEATIPEEDVGNPRLLGADADESICRRLRADADGSVCRQSGASDPVENTTGTRSRGVTVTADESVGCTRGGGRKASRTSTVCELPSVSSTDKTGFECCTRVQRPIVRRGTEREVGKLSPRSELLSTVGVAEMEEITGREREGNDTRG